MLGFFFHRGSARHRRAGIDQLGGCVGGAAGLTVVTILVFGFALGAGAFDETIRQKHLLFRIKELRDLARGNVIIVLELAVDVLREVLILLRVRGVIVVETDVEAREVFLMLLTNPVDQLLRGNSLTLGPQHNGGAVSIVCANVVAVVATHVLEAHPDIGLNVFQQVPQMNGPVGVGQGAGNQNIALLLARLRHGDVRTLC